MKPVTFTIRDKVVELHRQYPEARFYDTSTHAPYARDFPYVIDASECSPFVRYGNIPIPGSQGLSDSVEGIWQGLKVITGKIDPSYFRGKGRKRAGKPKGHLFHGKIIGYKQAREKIYVPAYTYMFRRCLDPKMLEGIYDAAMRDEDQFFFDVDANSSLYNTNSPLAHSSILAALINEELNKRLK